MTNLPPSNLRGAVDLSGLVQRANQRTAPAAGGDAAPAGDAPAGPVGFVAEANDQSFQRVVEISQQVPVVVEFYAAGLEPALGPIVESYGGRLLLATIEANANPTVANAFQVREVPAVAAIIGGRPVQLFLGIPSDAEVRQVLDELLQLAAQNGVTGTLAGAKGQGEPGAAAGEPAEPEEPPLPPLHQEAYDAISAGDYAGAVAAYTKALAQNPRDALAVAGLAQAALLGRLDGADGGALRAAAAADPSDVAAQLAVADLDVSGGHLDDAFGRLLDLFPTLSGDDRTDVRLRLVDYFEIAGAEDPRVVAARGRLTGLLY